VSEITVALPGRAPAGPAPRRAALPAMVVRCLRLSSRSIDAMITALMLPIMLMLLFVYVFGGAMSPRGAGSGGYVSYLVPGVLLLCAGFGAASTAVSVSQDMTGGIIDRFRSLNVGGRAILTGHVTASVVRNTVSTVLVLAVAFAIGFRPHASLAGWLAAAGLLARSAEAASGFTFVVMFLPYPSSTFVPIATMPGWLQGFARNQPVTPVVEAIRGLLLGTPAGH
jgi:ABC-2 type transport system permease protein